MNMFIIDNEVLARFAFFAGVFVLMSVWEVSAPRRVLKESKSTRWFNNLAVTVLNSFLVRLIFPAAAVGAAFIAKERNWGIFNMVQVSEGIAGFLGIVMLDLTIYAQHVFFHRILFFWRFHRMHHTDLDVDVTTGARFHPVEIIFSMVIKSGVVILLGIQAWSVIVFEVILNATSMFNHSNIHMNVRIDRILRTFVVTPDMHRVHHSAIIQETDSNFGFNLPWWDRLFRTYRHQPIRGHKEMVLGLANYREKKWLTLPWMLVTPFARRSR
jgi:sterol desaturase/sphingolipid hydroxylase (fatty acid hydroxylase superfamily)